ncbi:MAG TPA: SAV_915 family protein [Pseudonocardiaceae bacterium]|nr:SAV_915 family protein [Pseudonocardiaceae bacterium]
MLDVDEWEHLPVEVYVPVLGVADGGEALVELREMIDRRTALLVYSTMDRLLAGWGEHQSAMRVPARNLPALRRRLRFHALLLDVDPPAGTTGQVDAVAEPIPLSVDATTGIPVVYVPSQPFPRGSDRAQLELQATRDGRRSLMTYSSSSTLLDCCGPNQHFVAFPASRLADVLAQSGADTVLIDLPLPPQLRH